MKVTFTLYEKNGFVNTSEIFESRTNNRNDYSSDEIFANFREVEIGNIKKNILYRSSSPINPAYNRNNYVDELSKNANINTFINLAEDSSVAENYPNFNQTYYASKNIYYSPLPIDFASEEFEIGIKKTLNIFLNDNYQAPYLIHCTEGMDRTGFIISLLSYLSNADYEETYEDYHLSYVNYFLDPDFNKYESFIENTYQSVLIKVFSYVIPNYSFDKTNLNEIAKQYVLSLGFSKEELDAIIDKLT